MNLSRLVRYTFICMLMSASLGSESVWADETKASEASPPHNPLPDHILVWDALTKETSVTGYTESVHFVFTFTNASSRTITLQAVEASCGCTTVQLPVTPWTIPAAGSGQLGATVKLVGKARQQTESVVVFTDQGFQILKLQVQVLPPHQPSRSPAECAHDRNAARLNRQAIFHGDCASCHVKPGDGKEGKALYYAVCAVCHERSNHAVSGLVVPDLFAIQTPTNVTFWIDSIAHGKPGTFMPAFSTKDGGPLTEMQIANLVQFLNTSDNH